MSLKLVSSNKIFGGLQKVFSHQSNVLNCEMNFSIFLPYTEAPASKLPCLYWLSGLTCNELNFVQKAGAQQHAARHNLVIICPDTSPRGHPAIPGEDDSWDFGTGAGFYVDATREPWSKHYRMFSYVTAELPALIQSAFPVDAARSSIFGHSMGGHGALICALKNPGMYRSVSAFAPISNPTQCPWGKKALGGYLGEANEATWKEWDATELVGRYNGPPLELFVDQGSEDNFLKEDQLLPKNLVAACQAAKMPVVFHMREGYDHSYFYIATFVGEHIEYHAKHLK